jgi:hypothetical protein
VLADQRLGHPERVDELVHAAVRFLQLQNDRDAHRSGQRPQQFAGGVEDLPRRRGGERGPVVLVVVGYQTRCCGRHATTSAHVGNRFQLAPLFHA